MNEDIRTSDHMTDATRRLSHEVVELNGQREDVAVLLRAHLYWYGEECPWTHSHDFDLTMDAQAAGLYVEEPELGCVDYSWSPFLDRALEMVA